MTKKRILIVNEFSELNTGFSTYMHYLIPRLYKTGKYEIAEQAVYTHCLHPKIGEVPWRVYPNEPDPRDGAAVQVYQQDKLNQFGKGQFDEICLDFQPDIVITIRDWWMDSWIEKAAYRRCFKWITMPTVDGEPQKQEWLDTYKTADKLLTYSHWGKSLLERQSNGQLKVEAVASPCPDLNIFKPPADKAALRQSMGIKNDLFIIQSVMRNQPRKLYPDLMKVFAKYLKKCENAGLHDLASRSFLYFHTTYPDLGWNLPVELRKHKLSHKVLFTYMCDNCGAAYPSFFNGEACLCKNCGQPSCRLPNTAMGVDRTTLAKIMSVADVYIQYSVCEGFGMPINDAKACGVPVMAVEYSAMTEQAHNGGGIGLPVQRFFQEPVGQTNQLRAFPDNEVASQKLFEFATASQEYRDNLGKEARACVEKHYDWDNVAKTWERIIDAIPVDTHDKTWLSVPQLIQPAMQIPNNLDNAQFVHWCYTNILKAPQDINTHVAQKTIELLNVGHETGQGEDGRPIRMPVDRNRVLQSMFGLLQYKNQFENHRYEKLVLKKDDSNKFVFAEV